MERKHGHLCDRCGKRWEHHPSDFSAETWKAWPRTEMRCREDVDFLYLLEHLCPHCGAPQFQKAEYHDDITYRQRLDISEMSMAIRLVDVPMEDVPPMFRDAATRIVAEVEPMPKSEFMFRMLMGGTIPRFERRRKA